MPTEDVPHYHQTLVKLLGDENLLTKVTGSAGNKAFAFRPGNAESKVQPLRWSMVRDVAFRRRTTLVCPA